MRLCCVGLGPGGAGDLTVRARSVLEEAEVIVGYTTYVDLVRDQYPHKEYVATPMRREEERCRLALARASRGERVAVVSSGDPGVYGMAGLLLELAPGYPGVEVEVVSGVTAATGGATLLGAPLMGDWCCISLSDLMVGWDGIERRLVACASAGLVICLYNPSSRQRSGHLARACDALLSVLDGSTVCGWVRNVGRPGETSRVLTLRELRDERLDMTSCAFVGNAQTRVVAGRMVTPRGYAIGAGTGRVVAEDASDRGQLGVDPGDGGGKVDASADAPDAVPGHIDSDQGPTREVLVFGGTSEGRELVEWLCARGRARVVVATATPYGEDLVTGADMVSTVVGPLAQDEKRRLVAEHDFCCIVDATHPFARHISASVRDLARSTGTELIRVEREEAGHDEGEGCVWCDDAAEAARVVAEGEGPVLLTTGTKDLATFVGALEDFERRLYVRVLPTVEAIDRARALGVPTGHVVAMQGPFSTELNLALIRQLGIAQLVTKDSGDRGGFAEKVAAGRQAGARVVVIRRPREEGGVSLAEAKSLLEVRHGV